MSTDPADPGTPTLRPMITEDQFDSMMQQIASKYPGALDPRRRILEALCINWKHLMVGIITPQQKVEALEDFTNLVLHGLMRSEATDEVSETATWAPAAQYHGYSSRARVRTDAFGDDDPRRLLNGKRGTIVGIRHGEVIMDLDVPTLDGVGQVRDNIRTFEVNISHLVSRR